MGSPPNINIFIQIRRSVSVFPERQPDIRSGNRLQLRSGPRAVCKDANRPEASAYVIGEAVKRAIIRHSQTGPV